MEGGRALVLLDALEDPRFGQRNSVILSNLRSILCVPLRSPRSNRVFGLLYGDNRQRSGAFGQEHLDHAKAFGAELEERLDDLASREPQAPEVDLSGLLEFQWL